MAKHCDGANKVLEKLDYFPQFKAYTIKMRDYNFTVDVSDLEINKHIDAEERKSIGDTIIG